MGSRPSPRSAHGACVVLAPQVLGAPRVVHCLRHTAWSADMLARRLVVEATDAGSDDNVTVVVAILRER